jgi:hypothetical protein
MFYPVSEDEILDHHPSKTQIAHLLEPPVILAGIAL